MASKWPDLQNHLGRGSRNITTSNLPPGSEAPQSIKIYDASVPVAPGVTIDRQITTSTLVHAVEASQLEKINTVAKVLNEFPMHAWLDDAYEINQLLSTSSGFSVKIAEMCSFLLRFGIYDSLKYSDQRRKFSFRTVDEIEMLRDCIAQEPRGRENWFRVARVLRATNMDYVKEVGIKMRASENVIQPTIDGMLLGYYDGSPARIDWSHIAVPIDVDLQRMVKAYSKYPITSRIRDTHPIDMSLMSHTELDLNVAELRRLVLQVGIYEFLSKPECKKRIPNFKLEVERKHLKVCIAHECEGFINWDRVARAMHMKDWMIGKVAWRKMKEEEESAAAFNEQQG